MPSTSSSSSLPDPACRTAPAALRNRDAILQVLRQELPASGLVLEVASGSGEHACYFASQLKTISWQPSDVDTAALQSIDAWRTTLQVANLRPALSLNAAAADWPLTEADAVVSINMIHIAPYEACEGLMRGAGRLLPPGGLLYMYGPYKVDGQHTAPSNAQFDEGLRSQNSQWGVRDIADVNTTAAAFGLQLQTRIAMPANNLSLIFRRVQ